MMKKFYFFIFFITDFKIFTLDSQSTQRCMHDNVVNLHNPNSDIKFKKPINDKNSDKKKCDDLYAFCYICFYCSGFLLKELCKKIFCCK